MANLLSKLWPGLALAIIALLAFLLIRGCGKTSTPAADSSLQAMTAIKAGYDSAKRVDSPAIAQLTKKSDSLGDVVDSLVSDLLSTQEDLQARAGDLSSTLAALDKAKANRDTAAVLAHGDILEAEVKTGIPAVEGYTHLTDSLVKACVSQSQVQDSIIAKLKSLAQIADTTISRQQLQYAIIHMDDLTKTAQLKVYKPVAIGGVALIAALIVLKIISH